MNYCTLYPVAKRIRDYFAQDVVCPVNIRVDPSSVARPEQPTLDALACIDFLFLDWFKVEETALAGVAFLRSDHLDAHQLGFVRQQIDKAGVRYLNKILVGARSQIDLLLPVVILADDQCPHPAQQHHSYDPPTDEVQVSIDLAVALVGQYSDAFRRVLVRGQC